MANISEEYDSEHTGPVIDAGITRVLPGGEIDQAINSKPNPNLLDNWYFGNPVNQRGKTEYTGAVYGIDRWRGSSAAVEVELRDTDIKINASAAWTDFWQVIENPSSYAGKTVTVSVLVTEVENANGWQIVVRNVEAYAYTSITAPGLYSATWTIPEDAESTMQVMIQAINATPGYIGVLAAKLELGSEQTLAHQDKDGNWVLNEIPNYGEELAKCQRYQLKLIYGTSQNYAPIGFGFANNTTSIRILIPTPATMRASPTLSYLSGSISGLTILCDGKQLIPESVNTVNVLPYGVALMFTVSDATSSAPCVLRATSAYCILDANL